MEQKRTSGIGIGNILLSFAKSAMRYPVALAFAAGGAILVQVASITLPIFLKDLVNIMASSANPASYAAALHALEIIAILYVAQFFFRRFMGFGIVFLEANVMYDLNDRAFAYLLRHSQSFFANQFSGALTRRVSKYAQSFESIADTFIMTLLPSFVYVFGAVLVVSQRSLVLGASFGAWCVIFVCVQIVLSAWRQRFREERSRSDSEATGAISDAISNHNTIALFSAFVYEIQRFEGYIGVLRRKTIESWTAEEYIWGFQGFLMIVIEVGLFYGTVYFWEKGLLTVGDFVLVQIYIIGTIDSLISITQQLRRLYDAFADAQEMTEILQKEHEIRDVPGAAGLKVAQGAVELKDVGFFFNPERPILEHFNLSIGGGEKIALVGHSGAGKSTITRLLLRFYDVKSGAIEIDGQNISQVTQESLRNAIAFVPQEPILFHRSLMENIRYGRRDASDEQVIEAAKKAHCDEFISQLADGYGTFVGERGVKLSGGERQRVAIARAILKDAPILVLDEATSSLDSESEALIQDSLRTLMRGRTTLVIAHRLSTIMNMDRIIVIENGEIAAQGTHAELLKEDGLYQKLWSIQAGGFLGDEE